MEDDEDFDEDDSEECNPVFYLLRVKRSDIEKLLACGQVDTEEMEIGCENCSEDITIFPTLILEED
jgi:hypothetical protein